MVMIDPFVNLLLLGYDDMEGRMGALQSIISKSR